MAEGLVGDVRGGLALPVAIEGITRAWLEAALRVRNPGVGLRDAAVLEVIHGTCTKIRIALEPDDAGRAAGIPERVILKGGFEPHSRQMHYMHGEEVHAYADVAPHSPLRMPECWFAGYDPGAQQGIVIMEDLVARGVRFLHPQVPLGAGDVARRLTVLARHHALRWNRAGGFGWAPHIADATYFESVLTEAFWQACVSSSRGAAASVRFHDLAWMKGAIGKLNRLSRELPCTLIHGDTHLGNLYVDGDGEPGFFDSLPHWAPAMYEISYHITGALDVVDRREHERALVGHYREELVRCGVEAPSLEAFMWEYGCYLANGYAIFLVNASEFQPEAINTAYTARFSAAMLDHGTLGLLEGLE